MDSHVIYSLPSVVDIRACMGLFGLLQEQLAVGHGVVVEASAVEKIATPGLQCLMSAGASYKAAGKKFFVQQRSAAFVTAVEMLGLEAIFAQFGGNA